LPDEADQMADAMIGDPVPDVFPPDDRVARTIPSSNPA
jgi:hypothetical protein